MDRRHWFRKVTILKSPGFATHTFPPIEELSAGMNILWGPNGVGKTTFLKALRTLVFSSGATSPLEAQALMETPKGTWDLNLSAGTLVHTSMKDNLQIALEGSRSEWSESYSLGLQELMQEKQGPEFLVEVQRQMQGGVNLALAWKQAGGIKAFSTSRNAASQTFRKLSQQWEDLEAKHRSHLQDRQKLDDLRQQIDQRESLRAEGKLLETIQRYKEIQKQLQEVEAQLASYPVQLKHLNTYSFSRYEELSALLDTSDNACNAAKRSLQTLRGEYAALEVDQALLAQHDYLASLETRFDQVEQAFQKFQDAERQKSSCQKNVNSWNDEHTWLTEGNPSDLKKLVRQLEDLASNCEPLRCTLQAKREILSQLGAFEEIVFDPEEIERLLLRFRELLKATYDLQAIPERKRRGILLPSILVLSLFLGFGILGSILHPVFLGVGSAFLALVMVFTLREKPNADHSKAKEDLQERQKEINGKLTELGIESVDEWGIPSLQLSIGNLERHVASIGGVQSRNKERDKAKRDVDTARASYEDWLKAYQQAGEALHLKVDSPALEGAQFFNFSTHLLKWSEYQCALREAVSQAETLSVLYSKEKTSLETFLGIGESTFPEIKAKVGTTIDRYKRAAQLQSDMDNKIAEITLLVQQHEDAQTILDAFFRDCGFEKPDVSLLRALVDQVPDYSKDVGSQLNLHNQLSRFSPEIEEEQLKWDGPSLEKELAHIGQMLVQLDKKAEEWGALDSDYRTILSSKELEQAAYGLEKARQQLEAQRTVEVEKRMITHLFQKIQKLHEEKYQPEVIGYANRYLGAITDKRFSVSANTQGFFATDHVLGENFTLDELSSGTRVQLLLSIRMGFIELQEGEEGAKYPLYVDEVMANSDDQRSMAIAEALIAISKHRQVFYCTAQQDEVEKLKNLSPEATKVIALEDLKRGYQCSASLFKPDAYIPKQQVELVDDYHEYGLRLQVPAIHLHDPIGTMHSWYLCTDSKELFSLLAKSLDLCGQAMRLDDDLRYRFTLLEQAQKEALVGRPRKLYVQDLNDADLKLNRKAAYWNQILQFLAQGANDGNALLQAIEDKQINRMSDSAKEECATWLFEKGFASEQQPNTIEEIMARLCLANPSLQVGLEAYTVTERYLTLVL